MPRQRVAKLAMFGRYAGATFSHSTADFPYILEDTAKKSLRGGYEEAPHTWSAWMSTKETSDFDDVKLVDLGAFPALAKVLEGEEYGYATLKEEREKIAVIKYGRMISLTWEALLKDDLDAFTEIPNKMGAAARRLENLIAYSPLITAANGVDMSDGNPIFHSSHANLTTETTPDVDSLGVARMTLAKQTGQAGELLNIQAKFILVPVALLTLVEKLVGSVTDPGATAGQVLNPFYNKLQVIAEPLLDANAAYAGSSDTAWYVMVGTNSGVNTIKVVFLEGYRQPTIERTNGDDVDGIKLKVRHCVGAGPADYRGMVKSPGA